MHSVNLTQNVLPTLDLVEGGDINLAGTKGDRVMINQTPDLAWDILMEMASGQVGEGQA